MRKPSVSFSYFDIISACDQPGCPICRLDSQSVDDWLASVVHESVNDPDTRAELRQSLGFCSAHTWRLQHTGAGALLSIAIIYQDLSNHLRHILADARYEKKAGLSLHHLTESAQRSSPTTATQAIVRQLQPQDRCPACVLSEQVVSIATIALTDALTQADPKMLAALQTSDGLCLPHLIRALELVRTEEAYQRLVQTSQHKLEQRSAEMGEFIRKHDYRYQNEHMGPEGTSWQSGMAGLVGEEPGAHLRKHKP